MERKSVLKKLTVATLMWSVASLAFAHGEGAHAHDAGLIAGLAHPFSGLDHLLAMVAVGLWAVQKGGRAMWALPVTFVCTIALGSALGVMGMALPGVEVGIALSVMVLGLVIAFQSRWSLQLACLIAGFFALFHGIAHGVEMPLATSPLGYGFGMMAATALLHGAGVMAGMKLHRFLTRAAGVLISMAGLGMLYPLMG